ncbi:MAG TPA: selenocysteine-specific translation elongation factor [Coriobacteriia bacterium]|nr:selenocysteine-specific translation elongation factor [Coriobacteriia bacterium]
MADQSLVLGTAGHIDHGKSSLIKALTGTDPDRLKEEKERGITIELGFARLALPSGRTMGVVDVPGHEKFVRQMVAGATGVDVVLLVVAADDGVMPQTREHLAIVDLLGIDRGVVALTKADLVDEDWLELVRADIEALLRGTGIEGAPIVPVSSKTGAGLPDLLEALDSLATETPSRQANLPMRLPVDRVFTISGAGTVVTGTMWSGTASKDDPIEVLPGGLTGRVRGVQVHGVGVDKAHAGQRVAMNVAGVERDEIDRGDIIAAPGTLTVTDRFDARFTFLGIPGDERPFQSGTRVHVHHGTREVLGRVLLMEADSLQPGQSALAQVRLEDSLAPRYEDRFIVRSYSPVYTIGGGVVLDALPPRRTTLKPHERELLDALVAHDLSSASVGLLAARGLPMTSAQVAAALGVPRPQVADELNRAKLERLKVGGETAFIAPEALEHLLAEIESELLAFHETEPKATGIATSALRTRVERRLTVKGFDAVLEEAVARGLVVSEKGQVRHPKAAVSALAAEQDAEDALVPLLDLQGLAPSGVVDLATQAGVDATIARRVLARLANEGKVTRLSGDMYFSNGAIEGARERLTDYLSARPQGASTPDLKEPLGVSRKYAVPLLEYFDAQGMTKREGDLRVLRKG